VDPVTGSKVHFRELADITSESLEGNLIMPEPCPSSAESSSPAPSFGQRTQKAPPWGLCKALTNVGLFIGQSKDLFAASTKLAQAADAAERSF
jgi:hypothetical protein